MKKLITLGILFLTFMLAFSFTAVLAEGAAAGRFTPPINKGFARIQGGQIQERHSYNDSSFPIFDLNKHEITLKKGKSETLKASLKPGGKSVTGKWYTSNPKIAKVSSAGKVTAVAPGTAVIWIYSEDYNAYYDNTGYSNQCYVTVPGDAKDAKPLGISDRTYYYGKTKLIVPAGKYNESLALVKKSIGGQAYYEVDGIAYYNGLRYDSKDRNKAHTDIYIYGFAEEDIGFGYDARLKSPIKTSRGIVIGTKKSVVQQQYGLPTYTDQYSEGGTTYEILSYYSKEAGKNLYTTMTFHLHKSKGTVSFIYFYLGA